MKRFLILTITFVILLCLSGVAGVFYVIDKVQAPLRIEQNTLFSIERGGNAYRTVKRLRNEEVTTISPLIAKVWLRFFAQSTDIKSGTYMLQPGQSLADAFATFTNGDEYLFSVSLVEGLTLAQWQDTLKGNGEIQFDLTERTLAQTVSHSMLLAGNTSVTATTTSGSKNSEDCCDSIRNPEGLYLADTYFFTKGTKASEILTRANKALFEFLMIEWKNRDTDLPLSTPYEALILASIIEKETAVPEERDLIAGVFVNRLNKKMRLQTDPTVIYGIGPTFDGNITRKHLRTATPYNTYVIKGLPPTPIAMAGKAAIKAALSPRTTDALYFVAKGDGSHQFSNTLEEHNAAVRQFQLKR